MGAVSDFHGVAVNIFVNSNTYHYLAKALKNIKQLLVVSCFLQISNKQSSGSLWMKLVDPSVQRAKLILAFRFCYGIQMGKGRTSSGKTTKSCSCNTHQGHSKQSLQSAFQRKAFLWTR